MTDPKIGVVRLPVRLGADSHRVIARPFLPGGPERIRAVIARIVSLSDREISTSLAKVLQDYRLRHKDIRGIFRQNYTMATAVLGGRLESNEDRRLLIGAYFTHEYSLESAALFNPSMVLHPDQSGMLRGVTRFIMSVRACGEGHISSIEFRTGTIDLARRVHVDPLTPFAISARPEDDQLYDKGTYVWKLLEMGAHSHATEPVLERLDAEFTMSDLKAAIEACRPADSPKEGPVTPFQDMADSMLWLAHSNYHLDFSPETALSERVIFPVSESESRGIEDARFVRFIYPDGRVVYYATYSAYNGLRVLPQLIETTDFRHFKMNTLNGRCVQNKGMALFPRKVGNDFVMAGRLDGENIYILRSDNIHFWNESKLVYGPKHPWEFIQVGNCGSPIETDKGWVLLTHGVGAARQYCISALLLDLEDPSRIIGELASPLIVPNDDERDGYVPNVVYSCGPMRHEDHLVIPYAIADTHIAIATVSLPELLAGLTAG